MKTRSRTARLEAVTADELLEHEGTLRRIARSLVRGEDAVDDIVQQSFLNALSNPPLRGTNLAAWFLVVARNVVRRRYNVERDQEHRRRRLIELKAVPTSQESTVQGVARAEFERRMGEAVVALDPKYRAVIVLRYYKQLGNAKISEIVEIPLETVRTRLKRGLRQLERRLDRTSPGASNWREGMLAIAGWKLSHPLRATPTVKAMGSATLGTNSLVAILVAVSATGLAGVYWLLPTTLDAPRSPDLLSLVRVPGDGVSGAPSAGIVADRAPAAPQPLVADTGLAVPEVPSLLLTCRVVDALTDLPIAGATVHMEHAPSGIAGVGARVLEAASDADGVVTGRLVLMSPGQSEASILREISPFDATRVLHVEADGYAPWRQFQRGSSDWLAGARAGHVDVGVIRLQRGTEITGRAVSAAGAEPLGGGTVYVGESTGLSMAMSVGRVLADGRLQMEHRLGPPRTHVAGGGGSSRIVLTVRTARGMGWVLLPESVGTAQVVDVEVVVGPLGSLALEVVDSEGEPLEGATVRIQPCFQPLAHKLDVGWPPVGTLHASTTAWIGATDAQGLALANSLTCQEPLGPVRYGGWQGSGLPPRGLYQVAVRKPGYAAPAAMLVTLEAHRQANRRLVLTKTPPPPPLRGRVVDRQGEPLEGVLVTTGVPSGELKAQTDEQGRFELRGLAPGWMRQLIVFELEGYVTIGRKLAPRTSEADLAPDIMLLEAMPITGTVVDQTGRSFAGVRLELSAADEHLVQYDDQPMVTTDARGGFRFERATQGSWSLSTGVPADGGNERAHMPPPTAVYVRGGDENVRLVAPVKHGVQGATRAFVDVLDGRTHAPLLVQAAFVRAIQRAGAPPVRAEPSVHLEGARVFVEGLDPGDWSLVVTVAGRGRQSLPLHVDSGEREIRAALEFAAPGRIEGRVVWSSRPADDGPIIHLELAEDPDSGLQRQAVVGADDEFRFDGVPAGRYRLSLIHGDQLGAQVVDVVADEASTVRMQSETAGRIVFQCRVADLCLLRVNLTASVGRESGRRGLQTTVEVRELDTQGRSTMTAVLRPGEYEWSARYQQFDASLGAHPWGELQIMRGQQLVEARQTEVVWID